MCLIWHVYIKSSIFAYQLKTNNQTNDKMENLTINELVKLSSKKAGRSRMDAIVELCKRANKSTLQGALVSLDLVEPKAY